MLFARATWAARCDKAYFENLFAKAKQRLKFPTRLRRF